VIVDPIGRNSGLINTLLDAAVARHKLIAKNVANAETPGYRAQELRFSRALERALSSGEDVNALGDGALETVDRDTPVKNDGNSVDLEREFSELSSNALAYQTLVTIVAMKTNLMRSAVAGRNL
jgi:flagellar basal-body rod protein FlgB